MKIFKYLLNLLPLALGGLAALWTSLDSWISMKEGLIAFLGFLAAALVQVMPVTANFLQSDKLTVEEASQLTSALTKQQHYWIGLLFSTVLTLVLYIVAVAFLPVIKDFPILFYHPNFMNVDWSQVVCFFVVTALSFVFIKMLGLFDGILSLHNLRVRLVLDAAKRNAKSDMKSKNAVANQVVISTIPLPEGYGQVVDPISQVRK